MNVILATTTADQITSNILNGTNVITSAVNSFGTQKTLTTSELLYLSKGSVLTTRLISRTAGNLNSATMDGGYSVYFIKSVREANGN